MIKAMVVGLKLLRMMGVVLRTRTQFQRSEVFPGYFKTLSMVI